MRQRPGSRKEEPAFRSGSFTEDLFDYSHHQSLLIVFYLDGSHKTHNFNMGPVMAREPPAGVGFISC